MNVNLIGKLVEFKFVTWAGRRTVKGRVEGLSIFGEDLFLVVTEKDGILRNYEIQDVKDIKVENISEC